MTDVITVHDHNEIDFERPGKTLYEVAFHYDGTWGNALVPLAVINGTASHPRAGRVQGVAAFGGTHGNEYEGQVAVWRLMHELDAAQISGRIVLMPRLNQPACNTGTRTSPLDGANMNRAFPGDPVGTLTYRIAHFVTSRVFPLVDVVLDIHAGGRGLEFALCTSFHLVKDPAQFAEMREVAALFDTPFVYIYSSGMARGLLTDQAEALGKITIGGEFGHSEGVHQRGVRHAYQGIKNVLHHYNLLPGQIERIAPERANPPHLVEAVDLEDYVPAPVTGIFAPELPVGSAVKAGQLVGYLYDFERVGEAPLAIRAPSDGYIILQPFQAPTAKGDTILVIGKDVAD